MGIIYTIGNTSINQQRTNSAWVKGTFEHQWTQKSLACFQLTHSFWSIWLSRRSTEALDPRSFKLTCNVATRGRQPSTYLVAWLRITRLPGMHALAGGLTRICGPGLHLPTLPQDEGSYSTDVHFGWDKTGWVAYWLWVGDGWGWVKMIDHPKWMV